MTRWQLQEAKNHLSEVVRKARDEGPQVITLHGRDAVVVLAAKEYEHLSHRPRGALLEFFRTSPLANVSLDFERNRDTGRPVKL